MLPYIYDFLSILYDKLKEKEKIRSIVLYGSFARGNPQKDSDIDLFIDVLERDKKEVEDIVRESLNEFEILAKDKWKIKNINNPISVIVDNLSLEKWQELRDEISLYGKTLYENFSIKQKKEKNKVLLEYDITELKQKDKMKVIRALYGYKIKHGKKIYAQEGILKELKGERLSNAILLNAGSHKKAIDFLSKNKIPIKVRRVWSS